MKNWTYKYFQPKELLSPTGLRYLESKGVFKMQGFAVAQFENFREFLDYPILCNFGGLKHRVYRSSKENEINTGRKGVQDSFHTQGIAFDSSCSKINTADYCFAMLVWGLYKITLSESTSISLGFRGIGCYPHKKFNHGDFRTVFDDYIVCWNGKSNVTKLAFLHEVKKLPKDINSFYEYFKEKFSLPREWKPSNEILNHKNLNQLIKGEFNQ